MACQIYYKNGKIERVLAPNGNESILYKDILNTGLDEQESLKDWAVAYTPSFKDSFGNWEESSFDKSKLDANGEPLVQDVISFKVPNEQADKFHEEIPRAIKALAEYNQDEIKSDSKFEKILKSVRQSLQDRHKELESQYGADRQETKARIGIIKASLVRLSKQAGIFDLLSVSDKDLEEAERVLNKDYDDIGFFDLMETKRILLFQADFDQDLASEELTPEQEVIVQKQRAKNTKLLHKFNNLITKKLSEASKDFGKEITEEDLKKAYKDMSWLSAKTLSLDASEIPQLQFAKELINWRKRKTQEDLLTFDKELKELTKNGEENFKKIFDAGTLISKYTKEFFEEERKLLSDHQKAMRNPDLSKADKSASFAKVDAFYRDNFDYTLSERGKELFEEHKQQVINANTFTNEIGEKEINQEAVDKWVHENSWESMGRIQDGKFVFERNTPKVLTIDNQAVSGKGWYRYLNREPIEKHQNPKYNQVKDLPEYKWYIGKVKEIIQKIPHEMVADLDMYEKFINQITLDLTESKMDLESIWKGVKESALDWYSVGVKLAEAKGEDLKLTDEKGRPKPLVKAVQVKDINAKDPLEFLAKAYAMAVTYEHKVEIQPKLDLLLYQVENAKSIPTNRFKVPFANKETANGLINASNALRYASSADLTGITRTDESLGTSKLTDHERMLLETKQKSEIRKVSAVRLTDSLIDYTRLTMIGLKPFTAAANLVIGMTNNYLYAARGTSFTDKNLDWATTKLYGSIFNFWSFGTLKKQDFLPKDAVKIAALVKKFGILPENLIEDRSQYGKVSKILDKSVEVLFKMQEGGEYLIASQILLAKMDNTKITNKEGKTKTLYDAYDKEGNWKTDEFGEQPEWNNITYKNDEGLNISKIKAFRDDLERVRSATQGDYQNPIEAKATVWGRLAFMFRTWLPRAVQSRFRAENTFNNTKGRYISSIESFRRAKEKEGIQGRLKVFGGATAVVLAKLTNLPLVGKHIAANPIVNWTESNYEEYLKELGLTALDIENVRVNIREMQYIVLMSLIAMALKGLADDDKDPLLNFNINLAYRTYQDLSFFASPSSTLSIIKDPIPLFKLAQDITDVTNAATNYMLDSSKDTYQKGPNKGKSKLLKESEDLFPVFSAYNSTWSTLNNVFNNDSYKYNR